MQTRYSSKSCWGQNGTRGRSPPGGPVESSDQPAFPQVADLVPHRIVVLTTDNMCLCSSTCSRPNARVQLGPAGPLQHPPRTVATMMPGFTVGVALEAQPKPAKHSRQGGLARQSLHNRKVASQALWPTRIQPQHHTWRSRLHRKTNNLAAPVAIPAQPGSSRWRALTA